MILRTTLIWEVSKLFSRRLILASIFGSAVLLSGCTDWLPTAHRLDSEQGNNVTLAQLEKLEIGMSKNEVQKMIGLPMISDPFHDQRWDYIYRYVPKSGFARKSLLTLEFNENKLVSIDDSEFIEP